MSKGVKMVLGVVAAVVIPFVAAPIAAAIGLSGTIGTALVGAGLGAGAAAATGQNPLLGAAAGGFGAFMANGGFTAAKDAFGNVTNALGFGGEGVTGAAAPVTEGVSGVTGVTSSAMPGPTPSLGDSGYEAFNAAGGAPSTAASTPSTGIASASSNVPTPPNPSEAVAAGLRVNQPNVAYVPGEVGSTSFTATTPNVAAAGESSSSTSMLGKLGDKLLSNPTGLAQLAMTMFNKPPQSLTAAEQAALADTARLAGENQALFEKRVSEAESIMNRKNNPEQAYAQTGMMVQRRLEEAQRNKPEGMSDYAARRSAIEGTRMGTLAASEAEKQNLATEQAGLAALPTTAPTGAAGLSLPIYAALDKRREAYNKDLSTGVGSLFGSIYGNTAKA